MQLLRKEHQDGGVELGRPIRVRGHGPAKDVPCQGQGRARHDGRPNADEILVEESNLGQVSCHRLDLGVKVDLLKDHLQKALDGRMADRPAQRLQNMPFHLDEHILVVQVAAHRLEFPDRWHPVLLVPILGSDEHGRTAHELIVPFVDHSAGAVSVEQVDGEVEGFGEEGEGGVGFDEKVQEVGPHKPLNFGLDVNAGHIR